MSNHLMSIEADALVNVTGGTGVTKSGASSSSTDTALTAQLTGLSDSIKDLAKPQANNNSSTMLMFVMAMALSRPSSPSVVYVGGRRGWW